MHSFATNGGTVMLNEPFAPDGPVPMIVSGLVHGGTLGVVPLPTLQMSIAEQLLLA